MSSRQQRETDREIHAEYQDQQNREANLSLAASSALSNFVRAIDKSVISKKRITYVTAMYFSLIRSHVDEYIKNEPNVVLKTLYYGEVISAIESFISDLKRYFPKNASEELTALFVDNLINPLYELVSYYSTERENARIPTAVATPIATETVAEVMPAAPTVQPRFEANTNVPGFVSRIREFVGGAINRLNNNPIPEAESLEPRPPTEGQPTNFRRGGGSNSASGGGA
jgi:hypothetical protein